MRLLAAMIFLFTTAAWGTRCHETVAGGLPSKIVAAYEELLGQAGAGVLMPADFQKLAAGDPFVFEPEGRAEAGAVAEGIRSLGALVHGQPGLWDLVKAPLLAVLEERIRLAAANHEAVRETNSQTRFVPEFFRKVDTGNKPVVKLALSRDGRRLAAISQFSARDQVRIHDVKTGEKLREFDLEAEFVDGALNGDGSVLVSCHTNQVRLWNTGTGKSQGRSKPFTNAMTVTNGFVDGDKYVLVTSFRSVVAIEVSDGSVRNTFDADAPVGEVHVSPKFDAVVVATSNEDETIDLHLLDDSLWKTGIPALLTSHASWSERRLYGITWAGDGSRWVAGASSLGINRQVTVRPPDKESYLSQWAVSDPVTALGISSDGGRVATVDSKKRLQVRDVSGRITIPLSDETTSWAQVGFIDSGHLWVFSDHLEVWNIEKRGAIFGSPSGRHRFAAYDPQTKMLFTTGDDHGGVKIWELGRIVEELR